GDVLSRVAQGFCTAELLEADEMRIVAPKLEEEIGAGFEPVMGAVVNDRGKVDGCFKNAGEMGALGGDGRAARQHARDDHQALGADGFGMGRKGGGAGRVLSTRADDNRYLRLDQTCNALHALLV